jgi:hypothetical protein
MFAPMKCPRPRNVAPMKCSRPWNVRAHEMFAPMKCSRPWNVRAHTLTIWARQNLQLLTPSQSGWRALGQMVLPLLHAVLKWGSALRPPSLYGRHLCRTVPAVVPARPAKMFASCPNVRGREYSGNYRRSLGADCSAPRTLIKELWRRKLFLLVSSFKWTPLEPRGHGHRGAVSKRAGLAHIFSPFSGVKNPSRLLSVL